MTVIVLVLTRSLRRCCSFSLSSGEGVGVAAGTFSGSISQETLDPLLMKLPSYLARHEGFRWWIYRENGHRPAPCQPWCLFVVLSDTGDGEDLRYSLFCNYHKGIGWWFPCTKVRSSRGVSLWCCRLADGEMVLMSFRKAVHGRSHWPHNHGYNAVFAFQALVWETSNTGFSLQKSRCVPSKINNYCR